MAQQCPWPGCEELVTPQMWGCKPHWLALPEVLKDLLYDTYTPGQRVSAEMSMEHRAVLFTIQAWIRTKGLKNAQTSEKPEA